MTQAVLSASATQDRLLLDIGNYYGEKIARHGPTPLGVDWPCQPTQELRFVQLLRLCDFGAPLSLNDVGCGYGALLALLGRRHRGKPIDYLGIDISAAMVAAARRRWRRRVNTRFEVASSPSRMADYSLASGIFNVKLGHDDAAWEQGIACTLADMNRHSTRGFAVNFLAPLDGGKGGAAELYRAPAARWASHCEREFGLRTEVLTNYGMREYTLLARRAPPASPPAPG